MDGTDRMDRKVDNGRGDGEPGNGCYFARPAERLVLEGCRLWSAGAYTGRDSFRETARLLYEELLDRPRGRLALAELSAFVSVLGQCAACPLKGFAPGVHHVTRDEVLLLGLLAGIQHGDDPVISACLDKLSCASRCEEVATAAASFAITLRSFGQRLAPIPLHVVDDILVRSRSVTIH